LNVPLAALPGEHGHYLADHYVIDYLATGRDLFGPTDVEAAAVPPLVLGDPAVGEAGAASATTGSSTAAPQQGFASKLWSTVRRLVAPKTEPTGNANAAVPSPQTVQPVRRQSGTRKEAHQIAAALGVRGYVGQDASRSRVLQAGSVRFLHLAAPGFFLGNPGASAQAGESTNGKATEVPFWSNPLLRVGLALARPAATHNLSGGTPSTVGDVTSTASAHGLDAEDGMLTVLDLTSLDLSRTEVVALTVWEPSPTEASDWSVTGLRHAIILAGAHALVTSLWPVPDGPRCTLMVDFYQRLLAGRSCAEALRQAQRQLRAAYPDPAIWGAFLCQGNAMLFLPPIPNST
jgi:CHAT domain-containing protein